MNIIQKIIKEKFIIKLVYTSRIRYREMLILYTSENKSSNHNVSFAYLINFTTKKKKNHFFQVKNLKWELDQLKVTKELKTYIPWLQDFVIDTPIGHICHVLVYSSHILIFNIPIVTIRLTTEIQISIDIYMFVDYGYKTFYVNLNVCNTINKSTTVLDYSYDDSGFLQTYDSTSQITKVVPSPVCIFCCTFRLDMKVCTPCYQKYFWKYYCSKQCQLNDWPIHKNICKKSKKKKRKKRKKLRICLTCNEDNSSNKQCARCYEVYYCSKNHQTIHWKQHKYTCQSKTRFYEHLLHNSLNFYKSMVYLYLKDNNKASALLFSTKNFIIGISSTDSITTPKLIQLHHRPLSLQKLNQFLTKEEIKISMDELNDCILKTPNYHLCIIVFKPDMLYVIHCPIVKTKDTKNITLYEYTLVRSSGSCIKFKRHIIDYFVTAYCYKPIQDYIFCNRCRLTPCIKHYNGVCNIIHICHKKSHWSNRFCNGCKRINWNAKLCTCNKVRYCDSICQKKHWQIHKPICKIKN